MTAPGEALRLSSRRVDLGFIWLKIPWGCGGKGGVGAKPPRGSHGKRRAASTGGRRVGVFDNEPRADKFLGKINDCIFQKGQGDRVDYHLLAFAFQHKVVFSRFVQRDFVLKTGTSAAFNGDTQGLTLIGGTDFSKALKRSFCDCRRQIHAGLQRFISQPTYNI